MSMMKLTRDITNIECPWLSSEYKEGTIVHLYLGCTYGCISPSGVPVTLQRGEHPFFEVPEDSIIQLES